MCTTLEEQVRGYTKTTTPNYSERLQKLYRNGEFFEYMLCPDLQKMLKMIYDLTRKGSPFIWGKEQDSFEEIKCRLIKPPVLHMPNKTGRFHL